MAPQSCVNGPVGASQKRPPGLWIRGLKVRILPRQSCIKHKSGPRRRLRGPSDSGTPSASTYGRHLQPRLAESTKLQGAPPVTASLRRVGPRHSRAESPSRPGRPDATERMRCVQLRSASPAPGDIFALGCRAPRQGHEPPGVPLRRGQQRSGSGKPNARGSCSSGRRLSRGPLHASSTAAGRWRLRPDCQSCGLSTTSGA